MIAQIVVVSAGETILALSIIYGVRAAWRAYQRRQR